VLKKAKADFESKPDDQKPDDQTSNLTQGILDSSRQIWLAGLGAFATARREGPKLFESLVKQGESVEAKTRDATAQAASAARDAAMTKAKEMQAMAGGTWDKLEQVFEERVARALGRLGVYSAADMERLTERVNALSEAVNELLKTRGRESASGKTARRGVKSGTKTSARKPQANKTGKRRARSSQQA